MYGIDRVRLFSGRIDEPCSSSADVPMWDHECGGRMFTVIDDDFEILDDEMGSRKYRYCDNLLRFVA